MIKQGYEERLTAEASLIQLDSGGITRETYKTLRPGKEVVEKAAESLQKLGFTIEAEGVVSISISGRKETFEKVFDIQFEKKSQVLSTGDEIKGTEASYYVPIGKPKVPEHLKDLVYDVVFPVPPTAFM
jgi:predicted transcriptional regulator